MKVKNFTLDIEADGPCPGLFSMVSFAVVPVDNPDQAFYGELRPITDRFEPSALASCKFTREQTLGFEPAEVVMAAFKAWAAVHLDGCRGVMVSDNPGFDFGFLTYYCNWAGYLNPFGHSCRRLGDLCAGMLGDMRASSAWKKWTTTRHTHHALDDARKMAEGFLAIRHRMESQPAVPPPSKR